jgi:hypothetical protein
MGTAHAVRFVVSQAHQGTREGVVGAKTETDGPGPASEAVSMHKWPIDWPELRESTKGDDDETSRQYPNVDAPMRNAGLLPDLELQRLETSSQIFLECATGQ